MIGIIAVVFVASKLTNVIKTSKPRITFNIKKDYIMLFDSLFKKDLTLEYSFEGNKDNPISVLNFQDKYRLLVYNLNTHSKPNLRNVMIDSNVSVHINHSTVYNEFHTISKPFVDISLKDAADTFGKKVFVNVSKKHLNLFANDSFFALTGKFDAYSIGTKENDHQIIFDSRSGTNLKTQILLISRNNTTYLVIIYPIDQTNDILIDEQKLLGGRVVFR